METPPSTAEPASSSEPARVAIIGAGGHGRVVLDILNKLPSDRVVGFVDANKDLAGRRIDGMPVLGDMSSMEAIRDDFQIAGAIVAIGYNGVRRSFADELDHIGIQLVNAIHPSADLAGNVGLGRNVVAAAGALVCAHCQIGDSAILNTGCIVDHETMIGTAAHICPGARLAGRVTVEAGAFVGIGATVVQSVRIGYEAIVGAGAVVIDDVDPMATVVGVPARPIKDLGSKEEFARWLKPEFLKADRPTRRPPVFAGPVLRPHQQG
jgi:sugar O-acyltransferase (sialic acid O-acetyltransferase NeuD family)